MQKVVGVRSYFLFNIAFACTQHMSIFSQKNTILLFGYKNIKICKDKTKKKNTI